MRCLELVVITLVTTVLSLSSAQETTESGIINFEAEVPKGWCVEALVFTSTDPIGHPDHLQVEEDGDAVDEYYDKQTCVALDKCSPIGLVTEASETDPTYSSPPTWKHGDVYTPLHMQSYSCEQAVSEDGTTAREIGTIIWTYPLGTCMSMKEELDETSMRAVIFPARTAMASIEKGKLKDMLYDERGKCSGTGLGYIESPLNQCFTNEALDSYTQEGDPTVKGLKATIFCRERGSGGGLKSLKIQYYVFAFGLAAALSAGGLFVLRTFAGR